ncbi:hypothetical protein [Burkholderia sp. PU8-34]
MIDVCESSEECHVRAACMLPALAGMKRPALAHANRAATGGAARRSGRCALLPEEARGTDRYAIYTISTWARPE